MSALYDRFRDLAGRMVGKFGGSATVTVVNRVYDARAGRSGETTTETVTVAVLGPIKTTSEDDRLITTVDATLTVAVAVGDRVRIGATTYTVKELEVTGPDGEPIVFKAVLET